jgi:hypothetical protein
MEPDMNKIEALADKYAEQFVDRYKKVAKKAFIDGVLAVLKSWVED